MLTDRTNKKGRILLTGAGGVAIPFLIELLHKEEYEVLAADMNKNAVGLYLADKGFVIPGGLARDFLPRIREICINEKVDAIVPLVDEELLATCQLEQDGVKVILPRYHFIGNCLDKFRLMQFLNNHNIGVPYTKLLDEYKGDMEYPFIIKPRTGRGSRGVRIISSFREFKNVLASSVYTPDQLLIQEYIDGPEFTVSVVVWRDGQVTAVVPKEIIDKKGVTRIAVTRHNDKINEACCKIQDVMQADGPFNVQLRLNSDGKPMIFEINPRFSTSISLTVAAGINEIGLILDQALFNKTPPDSLTWKEGVVLLRTTCDCFVEEQELLEVDLYRG